MSQNILEIKDLGVSFFTQAGEVKAVGGISYDLRPGEVLGIVGESGSGKSVSVGAMMGLLAESGRIVSGSITFNGRDITHLTRREMRKIRGRDIAMIYQDPMTSLNPVFTIGNQLSEVGKLHLKMDGEAAWNHAVKMLETVGIPNPDRRAEQYPFEFSGGMRQRAMIAMALSCQPKLLIADEPTTALDVTIQAQILQLMKDLKQQINAAIILITHDLGIVSDLCDKVVVMYAGRIVERGSINDIFYSPSHPYTRGLLACLPRLDDDERARLHPIEGTPVDLLCLPAGCAFAPRCNDCMKICLRERPPEVEIGDGHTSTCWLCAKEKGATA